MGPLEARVSVVVRLKNTAKHGAEVLYRLPVPPRASLTRFGLCAGANATACPGSAETLMAHQAPAFRWATPGDAEVVEQRYARFIAGTRRGDAHGRMDTRSPVARGWARHDAIPGARSRFASAVHGAPDQITIRAATVPPSGELAMHIEYRVSTPLLDGETHLAIPARPSDARIATPVVTGEPGVNLLGQPLGTPVPIEPFIPMELARRHSSLRRPQGTLSFARCTGRDAYCGTLELTATTPRTLAQTPGSAPKGDRRYAIAIDTSPSMRGPAQGRLRVVLSELQLALENAVRGGGTDGVSWFTFGPETRRLSDMASATAAAQEALNAVEQSERAVTSLAGLQELLRAAQTRTDLILVGDGGYGAHGADLAALSGLSRSGLRVHYVQLRRRPVAGVLAREVRKTGGQIFSAADLIDDALRSRRPDLLGAAIRDFVRAHGESYGTITIAGTTGRLRARLSMPALSSSSETLLQWSGWAPTRAWLHYAGQRIALTVVETPEVRTDRTKSRRPTALSIEADDEGTHRDNAARGSASEDRVLTAGTCDIDRITAHSRPEAARDAGVEPTREFAPIALATQACDIPVSFTDKRIGRGVPAETVQRSLRSQVIPKARLCLRADRRGRPNYQVRVVFAFSLQDQEVRHSAVEGAIAPTLRTCLEDALLALEVPYFEGTVRVHYPIYTLRALDAPVIQMSVESAEAVDALIRD